MSCPDWQALTAWREERDGREPAGYREALAHLDGGCTACRRQALAADPMLMFRAVPVMDIPEAQEVDEVEAMRQAVAAMRTASRMEALETRRDRQSWWKWASAAMLAVAALSVSSDSRFDAEQESLWAGREVRQMDFYESAGLFDALPAAYPLDVVDSLPDESLGSSPLREVQIDAGGMQIQMVYDKSLSQDLLGTT